MEEFIIPKPPRTNYINAEYGLKSWLLTKDHKRIALLYLGAISFFFFIGSLYAMAIRLELLTPQRDLVQSSTYNKMFTQHVIILDSYLLLPPVAGTGPHMFPLPERTRFTISTPPTPLPSNPAMPNHPPAGAP